MKNTQILIVDDNTSAREMLASAFEGRENLELLQARNGVEGVQLARDKRPDLVLMDIIFDNDERLGGVQAAEQIYSRYNIPAVLITNNSADKEIVESVARSNAYGFVAKPVSEARHSEINANIEIVLQKHAKETRVVFSVEAKINSAEKLAPESDTCFRFASLNKKGQSVFGMSLDEIFERELAVLLSPDGNLEVLKKFADCIKNQNPDSFEVELITPTGKKVNLHLEITAITPLKINDSEIWGGVRCAGEDITERKRLAQEILSQKEQHAREIENIKADIVHDAKNKLAMPYMWIGQLKDAYIKAIPLMEKAIASIKDADEYLVRSLTLKSEQQCKNHEELNLHHIIIGFDIHKTIYSKEGIELAIETGDELHQIMGNKDEICNALENLCKNAKESILAFRKKNGTVQGRIKISAANDSIDESTANERKIKAGLFVKIIVTDTGEGIEEKNKKKLGDREFTTKGEEGTGNGLASVKKMLDQHNGYLDVHSAGSGQGATISLCFPAHLPA